MLLILLCPSFVSFRRGKAVTGPDSAMLLRMAGIACFRRSLVQPATSRHVHLIGDCPPAPRRRGLNRRRRSPASSSRSCGGSGRRASCRRDCVSARSSLTSRRGTSAGWALVQVLAGVAPMPVNLSHLWCGPKRNPPNEKLPPAVLTKPCGRGGTRLLQGKAIALADSFWRLGRTIGRLVSANMVRFFLCFLHS